MSDPTRSGARSPFVRAVLLLTATASLGVFAGCSNPLFPSRADYPEPTPRDRLRVVRTMDMERFRRAEQPDPQATLDEQIEAYREAATPLSNHDRVPLSLEQCRAWTLENNLDLEVALVNPTIANQSLSEEEARFEALLFVNARHSEVDQATDSQLSGNQFRSSSITPGIRIPLRTGGTVSFEVPVSRSETDNVFATLNPSYVADLQFSISQPLLRGAGRRANTHAIRIAALNVEISEAATKLEVIRQLANADRAYWSLYAIRKVLDVRLQQYELAREQLDRADRRFRLKEAARIEVTRAQAGVAERLEGIIQAENALLQAQRNLKRLMNAPGLDVRSDALLELTTEPSPMQYELDAGELADAALDERMEMLQLELQLAQDMSTIDLLKNQALPLFTMDYSYGYNGLGQSVAGALDLATDQRFHDWSIGATFETPVGNDAAESRVHRAILQRLQRLSTKAAQAQSITQEIFNSVDAIDTAWQRILAARINALLAERTYEAEVNQFNLGLRTSTDVLDAAARLAEAQSAEIRALADYEISQVDLAFASGAMLGATRTLWTARDPRQPSDFVGERPENSVRSIWPWDVDDAYDDVSPTGDRLRTPEGGAMEESPNTTGDDGG